MERTSHLQHPTTEKNLSGWINGFIGVVIFSASLPATKVAVLEFDPVFLTLARASIAGVLALAMLGLFKARRPQRSTQQFGLARQGGIVVIEIQHPRDHVGLVYTVAWW